MIITALFEININVYRLITPTGKNILSWLITVSKTTDYNSISIRWDSRAIQL